MKKELTAHLQEHISELNNIDASFNAIWEQNQQHQKHFDALNNLEKILTDVLNKIDRFYTPAYAYNRALNEISEILRRFHAIFIERIPGQLSMEECRLRILGILEGMIKELVSFDVPSKNDPKFG